MNINHSWIICLLSKAIEEHLVVVSCRHLCMQRAIRLIGCSLIQLLQCLVFDYGGNLIYESLKVLHVHHPIHEKLRSISPNNRVYCVEVLSTSDRADHFMTTADIEHMQHLGLTGDLMLRI